MASSVELIVLSNRLPDLAARLPLAVDLCVRRATFDVEARAKAQLYEGHGVVTGNLKNRIESDFPGQGQGVVISGAEYSLWVNSGHRSFPGYHFMEQAAVGAWPGFLADLRTLERFL